MEKPDLHLLWQKGQKKITGNQKLSKMEIETYIKPRVKKSSAVVKINLFFYTIIAFAVFIILALNSIYFITNPVVLTVNAIGMIISAFIIYYGWYSYKQFNGTESGIHDLSVELHNKIEFYSRIYERWMWIIPTLTLLLIFAVGTMIDNENGTYRINKPLLFISINVIIFMGIYLINKVSHLFWLREIKDYLSDVDNQLMEGTLKIESRKKKYFWLIFLVFILLTVFFIGGIIKAI
jgi:hypothetical protein